MLRKATELREVSWAFRKRPLELEELDAFFSETAKARGKDARQRIIRSLFRNVELRGSDDLNEHILFFGYRGCGKSTELRKLQSEIQGKFLVVNFSIEQKLNPMSFHYIELFLVMMEQLFEAAIENDLRVSEDYLRRIQDWSNTEEVERIKEKHFSRDFEAGLEAKGGLLRIANLFAKFSATARSSNSFKSTLKQEVEPKLKNLISLCNELIRELRHSIHETQFEDIVIIVEDIDKAPLDQAKELFGNHISHFSQIQCHFIFSFPLALRFSPDYKKIEPYFTQRIELPMIEVKGKDGKVRKEGMEVMRTIAQRRMEFSLLASNKLLDSMILYSGGCLRDFFHLLSESSEQAMDRDGAKITKRDVEAAYLNLKKDYKSSIADYKPEWSTEKITVQQFYNELVNVAQSENKLLVDETDVIMVLRQNLMILGYNGEGWCDVHPIIRDILEERGMIDPNK